MPRGSPMWGLTHRTAQMLHDQCGSLKVHWLLNQHLTPNLWCQPMQEPIQHLSWGCIGYTQQTAVEAVHIAAYSVLTLHASCSAVTCVTCCINWVELLLDQSLKLAPG